MPVNYDLTLSNATSSISMGTLSNNEDGTAIIAPENGNTAINISSFAWSGWPPFPLKNPIQGPNSGTLPEGTYTFSNGQIYAYAGIVSQQSWTENKRWQADLNVADSYLTLTVGGTTFGKITGMPDLTVQFKTPNGVVQTITPFSWSHFTVKLSLGYGNFPAGEYDFSGGNPTLIKGTVAVMPEEDPPSDWTASSQGFSK
ncbi:MAG: hypothetical protein ABI977_20520 [Acidobacteriota bacterium]